MIYQPNSHRLPAVRRAGEAEDGPRLREEAGRVASVEPVADHHSLLVTRHHQVFIRRGPVHRWDGALQHTIQYLAENYAQEYLKVAGEAAASRGQ